MGGQKNRVKYLLLLLLVLVGSSVGYWENCGVGTTVEGVQGQPSKTDTTKRLRGSLKGLNDPIMAVRDPVSKRVYVTDQSNQRLLGFNLSAQQTFGDAEYFFGDGGWLTTSTNLQNPSLMAIDDNGRLFVADNSNSRVLWFNRASLLNKKTTADGVIGQLSFSATSGCSNQSKCFSTKGVTPIGVAVSSNYLFVSFPYDDFLVRVYNVTEAQTSAWVTIEVRITVLKPLGLAIASNKLYVASDSSTGSLYCYHDPFTMLSTATPDIITINYSASASNVLAFDLETPNILLISKPYDRTILVVNVSETQPLNPLTVIKAPQVQFGSLVRGIFVDENNTLLAADTDNNRILYLTCPQSSITLAPPTSLPTSSSKSSLDSNSTFTLPTTSMSNISTPEETLTRISSSTSALLMPTSITSTMSADSSEKPALDTSLTLVTSSAKTTTVTVISPSRTSLVSLSTTTASQTIQLTSSGASYSKSHPVGIFSSLSSSKNTTESVSMSVLTKGPSQTVSASIPETRTNMSVSIIVSSTNSDPLQQSSTTSPSISSPQIDPNSESSVIATIVDSMTTSSGPATPDNTLILTMLTKPLSESTHVRKRTSKVKRSTYSNVQVSLSISTELSLMMSSSQPFFTQIQSIHMNQSFSSDNIITNLFSHTTTATLESSRTLWLNSITSKKSEMLKSSAQEEEEEESSIGIKSTNKVTKTSSASETDPRTTSLIKTSTSLKNTLNVLTTFQASSSSSQDVQDLSMSISTVLTSIEEKESSNESPSSTSVSSKETESNVNVIENTDILISQQAKSENVVVAPSKDLYPLYNTNNRVKAYVQGNDDLKYTLSSSSTGGGDIISSVLTLQTLNGEPLSEPITICLEVPDDFQAQDKSTDSAGCSITQENACLAYVQEENPQQTEDWKCEDRYLDIVQLNNSNYACGETPHLTSFAILLSTSSGEKSCEPSILLWIALGALLLAILLSLVFVVTGIYWRPLTKLLYGEFAYEHRELKLRLKNRHHYHNRKN